MARDILTRLLLMVSMTCWLVTADQEPEIECPSGLTNLVNGFATECDVATIPGLQGHSASQILYSIIMEAPLDNSTIFRNNEHITCLFQNSTFALGGTEIGIGPVSITIPPIEYEGTLCLYVEKVTNPSGGLTLGLIRNLTRTYILSEGCNECGYITANYFTGNETEEGRVRIDWAKNADCIEGCIDPATDLKNTTMGNGGVSLGNLDQYKVWGSLAVLFSMALAL